MLELERKLKKMGKRVGGVADEIYEYVDEVVDGVEHSLRKQERKEVGGEGQGGCWWNECEIEQIPRARA